MLMIVGLLLAQQRSERYVLWVLRLPLVISKQYSTYSEAYTLIESCMGEYLVTMKCRNNCLPRSDMNYASDQQLPAPLRTSNGFA